MTTWTQDELPLDFATTDATETAPVLQPVLEEVDDCPSTIQDLVIVGSGPAGYTAAIYAARAGLKPLVIAASFEAGGALMNTTEVENYPGFPQGIMGPELMHKMNEQAVNFGAELLYDDVEKFELEGPVKRLTVSSGDVIETRAVIIAMGAAHRHLGVEGEERLGGRGVSYCGTCDAPLFRGKRVFVVGGGDTAVEDALFAARFTSDVTLIHRRDSLRASKTLADRLEASDVTVLWNTEVREIRGETVVESLVLDTEGNESIVPADAIFVAIGHDPRSGALGELAVDDNGYILTGATTATSVEGVFACGDIVDSRYRQAITAAGTGCAAALDAQWFLDGLE